ncbi:MAG: penicillin acylase family protein, partial [Bacteroidota bacterium]
MKVIRFVFFLVITLALITFLNTPYNSIPPLGKLLSPHQGFWQNAEKEAISTPSALQLEGLKDEVIVRFDAQLFPHIFANNDEDLFYAQGYVTAFHRLWQMEFQQLNTAGRLAEVLREGFLERDRQQRRKGLTYGAQRTLEKALADPEAAKIIKAYTQGVNAYIDQLDYADYPIEYKLLDYEPEPWTELKCALLLSMMSDDLSRGEADLHNTNALKLWGRDTFDILFPERHPDIDPVIPTGTAFDFEPIAVNKPDVQFPQPLTRPKIEAPDEKNGSNNFVVGGSKTADGSVLFANEPDLGLNLPSIWYVCHLNSPNYNVMGATLPGSPLVIIGMNDSIAWGMTNAKRDLVDWYYVEFRDDSREEYKYDEKWLKTQKVVEEFQVRGGTTVYDTIVFTHYGPVVYDRNYDVSTEQLNLAMRWTAHDASDYQTFIQLNQAYNYDAYSEALSKYVGPPQNIAFASAAGDIAIRISGKFPVKWEEQGKFIMDGRDSRQEWQEMMPWEHTYKVLNPPQGFVSSANQHPGDGTYPYYDYDYNFEYYRNRRINDRLSVMTNITEEDMMALQNDNFNYIASELLP